MLEHVFCFIPRIFCWAVVLVGKVTMAALQRVSAEVLRGGIRLNLVPGTVPNSLYVSMSNRFGRVCCMASKPSGPVRCKPSRSAQEEKTKDAQNSSETSASGVEDYEGCSSDVPLETETDRWVDVGLGAVNSSKKRRHKELTAGSSRPQRMDRKQGRDVPAPVLNLTYANGKKVETTLLNALGTLNSGNDEQFHGPDKGLVRSSSTLSKSFPEHATSSITQRMETKQGREVPAPVPNLTYANGRKVETTLLDVLGTLKAGNDEQFHTPDEELVRSSSNLSKSIPEHVGLENLGSELAGTAPARHEEMASAKDYALSLLAAAPQPAANLRRKLSKRHVSSPVIEEIIQDLQRCGLQSDREFAESFARSRWRSLSWGPSRIKYELKRRGVGAEDIQAAMKKVFETANFEDGAPGDNEEMELSNWGMTTQAKDHLLKQAQRQWQKGGSNVTHEARKRRMVGWLQRRGYGWPVITDVLKSCGEQPEVEWDE